MALTNNIVDLNQDEIGPNGNNNRIDLDAIFEWDRIIISPLTSGFSRSLVDKYREKWMNILWVWWRNPITLKKVAKGTNKRNDYIVWDLFSWDNNEARDFLLDKLPNDTQWWALYFNAAIEPDKTPVILRKRTQKVVNRPWKIDTLLNKNWKLLPHKKNLYEVNNDYLDPRTHTKWKVGMTNEKKNRIRRELVDKQIDFHRAIFEAFLNWKDKDRKFTILIPNSVITKFAPSGSEYFRLKKRTLDLVKEYKERLREKNIIIKVVMPWMSNTKMVSNRGYYNGVKTAKYVKATWEYIPMEWDALLVWELLNKDDIAQFMIDLSEKDPDNTPDLVSLASEQQLDFDNRQEAFLRERERFMSDCGITSLDQEVDIWEKEKKYLIWLRKKALQDYIESIPSKRKSLFNRRMKKNIIEGEKTLDKLPEKMMGRDFIQVCSDFWNNRPL